MASPPPPTVVVTYLPYSCTRGSYYYDYAHCSNWASSSSAIFLWVFIAIFFLLILSCAFMPYDYYSGERLKKRRTTVTAEEKFEGL